LAHQRGAKNENDERGKKQHARKRVCSGRREQPAETPRDGTGDSHFGYLPARPLDPSPLGQGVRGDGFLAELEIGANAGLLAVSALVVGFGGTGWTDTDTIVRSGKVTAIVCVIAAVVAVFRCGTYVVRGVLNKTGAIPPREPEGAGGSGPLPSTTELSRGRSIGNLERLLMIVAIGVGRYEVLGFLVSAKGLIRSREFENRAFAEYFILGTLASTTVALVVGIALRVSVRYFWGLEG